MQRQISKLLIAATIAATTSTPAAQIDSFSVASSLTYGYANEANASMQGELEVAPAIDVTLTKLASLVASARIRLDEQDQLEPGRYAYKTYSGASKPANLGDSGSAEIRDLYVEFRSEKGLTRLGKQQIVWGKLDGIKVLDLINPQDFREFIIDDFDDSRISLWSAYFDYSLGNWRAELALIPDGTAHAIPESGAWFELTAPRFRFGAAPGQTTPPVRTVQPGLTMDDSALGLRLSRQFGALDISAVAYSGTDPEPLGRVIVVDSNPVIEQFYERRDAFGLSFDVGLGSTVLRGEYVYQPERVFNARPDSQLTTIALDQHRGAIGLDVDGPLGIFMNIQYLIDTVADAVPGLVRPESDRIGTLYLRRAFNYDAVVVEARWYQSFTDDDRLASISVHYDLSDSTSLGLAAQHFGGVTRGLFGQFTHRDRITLSLKHVF